MSDTPRPNTTGCFLFVVVAVIAIGSAISFGVALRSTESERHIQVCELEPQKIVIIKFGDLNGKYSTDLNMCR